jgi:hypothetical protein
VPEEPGVQDLRRRPLFRRRIYSTPPFYFFIHLTASRFALPMNYSREIEAGECKHSHMHSITTSVHRQLKLACACAVDLVQY